MTAARVSRPPRRRLPRVVLPYLAASFLMGLGNAIFDTVFNFYLAQRGIDERAAGVVYAVATTVMALAVVPVLVLSRRLSRRTLLIGASVVYAAPFALLPVVSSVPAATAALSLILAGMLALLSVGNSIAGSLVDDELRPRLFSAFFVSYLGAGVVGTVVTSLVVTAMPGTPLRAYQLLLLTAFVAACLMCVFRAMTPRDQAPPAGSVPLRLAPGPGERRNLLTLGLSAALLGASMTLVFRFANIVFMQAYGLSVADISLVLGLDKAVSILGALVAPIVVARFSLRATTVVLGVLSCAALVSQTLMVPLTVFVGLYLLRLLLNYGQMPLLDTLAVSAFAPERTLLATGVRQSLFYVGGAGAAAVYGVLLGDGRWQTAIVVAAVCALGGALVMTAIREPHGPRTPTAGRSPALSR